MEFNQDSSLNDAIEFLENEKNKLEQRLFAQKKLDEIIPINLKNNLETFRKFFPNIYAKFKDYKLKSNYRLTCSENGEANILLPEGTLFYGDSPFHDCEKQVEIFLENQKEHLISNFNCAFEKNTYNQLHYYFKNRIYGKATEIVEKNKNISESNETLESIPLMIKRSAALPQKAGQRADETYMGYRYLCRLLRPHPPEPLAGHPCVPSRNALRLRILQDRLAQAYDAHAFYQ